MERELTERSYRSEVLAATAAAQPTGAIMLHVAPARAAECGIMVPRGQRKYTLCNLYRSYLPYSQTFCCGYSGSVWEPSKL